MGRTLLSPVFLTKRTMLAVSVLLSLLLVAYAPLASYAGAQTINAQALAQLKEKATEELDRRIDNLKTTLASLKVDVHIDSSGLNATASGQNGTASVAAGQDGLDVNVELSPELKQKAQDMVNKFIKKLQSLKDKVQSVNVLSELQSLAENIDSQFKLDQLTNIQGTVTKAVESLTGVFDKLKETAANLQSQVTKLKECATGVASGEGSVDVSASGGTVQVDASAPGCDDISINSDQVAEQAQSQLDNIKTIMSTIGSVLGSVLTLLSSLITTFSGLTGGLGSLSSLGDVSNLTGSLDGLLSSFGGLSSQLDVLTGLAGSASGLLSGVSGITSAFNF